MMIQSSAYMRGTTSLRRPEASGGPRQSRVYAAAQAVHIRKVVLRAHGTRIWLCARHRELMSLPAHSSLNFE